MGSEMFICASPRALILVTPYLDLGGELFAGAQDLTSKWVAAISEAPHIDEVAENVVDTLLQISADHDLRSSIPADIWLWLNERPSLPPVCKGRRLGGGRNTVRTVRALNDIGILTSYLILVWSEWTPLDPDGFAEMQMSVREDFRGVGTCFQRAELIQRLDLILRELDRRSGHPDVNLEDDELWRGEVGPSSEVMKDRYGEFKRILQGVDREATEIVECMHSSFVFLGLLTLMDLLRISLHLHGRALPLCP